MKQTPDGVVFSKSRYGWNQAYFVIDKSRDANQNVANESVGSSVCFFVALFKIVSFVFAGLLQDPEGPQRWQVAPLWPK